MTTVPTLDDVVQAAIAKAVASAVAQAKLAAHPVGSIYCSVDSTDPGTLFGGTWEEVSSGRVLQGADTSHAAGSTAEAGLPNVTGYFGAFDVWGYGQVSMRQFYGAFSGGSMFTVGASFSSGDMTGGNPGSSEHGYTEFDASKSNSIYGSSTTVQPPAFFVHIWKRTA